MRRIAPFLLLFTLALSSCAARKASSTQAKDDTIEIGTMNVEWFPCKDDGDCLKSYGIDLRYPPKGGRTNLDSLFSTIQRAGIEVLGVEEIVDPELFRKEAKKRLGQHFEFVYSPGGGSQKVGFLYDSRAVRLVGEPQTYTQVTLDKPDRLRPAFRAYFKAVPGGFDFHAIVVHLKASPRSYPVRQKQWKILQRIMTNLPKGEQKDADIILLGDFNNVSRIRDGEFLPIIERLNMHHATEEIATGATSFYKPNWREPRIVGSVIDQIVVSRDARAEFVEGSVTVGGFCALGEKEWKGEAIPAYYDTVSDHCPVFASFKWRKDND